MRLRIQKVLEPYINKDCLSIVDYYLKKLIIHDKYQKKIVKAKFKKVIFHIKCMKRSKHKNNIISFTCDQCKKTVHARQEFEKSFHNSIVWNVTNIGLYHYVCKDCWMYFHSQGLTKVYWRRHFRFGPPPGWFEERTRYHK